MPKCWFCHGRPYVGHKLESLVSSCFFSIILTQTVDTDFKSALSSLIVNMILLTVTGAMSPLLSTFTLTGEFTLTAATVQGNT